MVMVPGRIRSTRSIMVVDDDPAFCCIMRELLKRSGFHVQVAHSVREALGQLEHKVPDMILTDVMMPEVDGLQLVRRLRACPKWASIPTVVVSARVMEDEQVAAREAGADAFLAKPFSTQLLRSTIENYLPVTG